MRELTLYQQKRQDEGIRTAITIDGVNALHHFQEGKDPPDPALLWYVDVRCKGRRLPKDPEKARQWFLDHQDVFQKALSKLTEKFQAGLDIDLWPVESEVANSPKDIRITIVCSVIRRISALRIANILGEIRDNWVKILQTLQPLQRLSA